jgi:hypothetical protein
MEDSKKQKKYNNKNKVAYIYSVFPECNAKDIEIKEHVRLSIITLRHSFKLKNSEYIAILHFFAYFTRGLFM